MSAKKKSQKSLIAKGVVRKVTFCKNKAPDKDPFSFKSIDLKDLAIKKNQQQHLNEPANMMKVLFFVTLTLALFAASHGKSLKSPSAFVVPRGGAITPDVSFGYYKDRAQIEVDLGFFCILAAIF